MKRRIQIVLLLLIIILLLIPLYPTDALPETITTAAGSVFEFTTRYKYEYDHGSSSEIDGGTAFVISTDSEKTYLLTCAHCVNEQILEGGIVLSLGEEQTAITTAAPVAPEKITLFFDRNNWGTANPVFISEEYDVAVLEIETGDNTFTPLVLTEPAWLGKVFALGYPHEANPRSTPLFYDEDTKLFITSGRIISFINLTPFERKLEEKPIDKIIVHTALANHGNSGGPLLNAKGEIVGLNCCGIRGSEDTGFKYTGSIDSITLGKLLRENGIAYGHHTNSRVIRDIIIVVLVVILIVVGSFRPKKADCTSGTSTSGQSDQGE